MCSLRMRLLTNYWAAPRRRLKVVIFAECGSRTLRKKGSIPKTTIRKFFVKHAAPGNNVVVKLRLLALVSAKQRGLLHANASQQRRMFYDRRRWRSLLEARELAAILSKAFDSGGYQLSDDSWWFWGAWKFKERKKKARRIYLDLYSKDHSFSYFVP